MNSGSSFDPDRDPDSRIQDVQPQPTPWRQRSSIVEGRIGGIQRPNEHKDCENCPEEKDESASRGGAFSYLRHNRSLSILLIDTVIVVALFFIVLFVMVPSMGRVRIDDVRINTAVDTTQALVIVRAEFYRRPSRDTAPGNPETRIIAIAVGDEILRDLAPSPGQRRTLEIRFPISRLDGDIVTIDLQLGDERRSISRSIVD